MFGSGLGIGGAQVTMAALTLWVLIPALTACLVAAAGSITLPMRACRIGLSIRPAIVARLWASGLPPVLSKARKDGFSAKVLLQPRAALDFFKTFQIFENLERFLFAFTKKFVYLQVKIKVLSLQKNEASL